MTTNLETCRKYFPNLAWRTVQENAVQGCYEGTLEGLDYSLKVTLKPPIGGWHAQLGNTDHAILWTPRELGVTLEMALQEIRIKWTHFTTLNAIAVSGSDKSPQA